jgi:hypothetical protein
VFIKCLNLLNEFFRIAIALGYAVVAIKERIEPLLSSNSVVAPNNTALSDDNIWRCCFMAETDASNFLSELEKNGLNVRTGPDSDAVLANEFDQLIEPYCEWLLTNTCDADLLDVIVSLGIGWMLGDWFGLWGDD